MEETLELSKRYKDKNPPAKQAVATQRVKSKVDKANKRRKTKVATDRERAAFLAGVRGEGVTLSTPIENIDAVLMLSGADGYDFPTLEPKIEGITTTLTLNKEKEQRVTYNLEPTLEEVQAHADKHGIEDVGEAFASLQNERMVLAQSYGVEPASGLTPEQIETKLSGLGLTARDVEWVMQEHNLDFDQALSKISEMKLTARSHEQKDSTAVAEVEQYMKENDIEDFGKAARLVKEGYRG